MNIWNKVFLGAIFVATIAAFVLGAVEFHIRNTGQKKIVDLTKKIADSEDKYARIVGGADPGKLSPDKPLSGLGFDELRGLLRGRYDERGRAWFGCIVDGGSMEREEIRPTGALPGAQGLPVVKTRITITEPFKKNDTGGDTDEVVMPETLKGVVYVFEEKEAGEGAGAFLGRFNVNSEPKNTKFTGKDENEKNGWWLELITIDAISEEEIAQILAASKFRWAVYLTPPVDRIAGQRTEEVKPVIPDELREQMQHRPMPELEQENKEGVDARIVAIWEKYRKEMDDPEAESAIDFSALLDWLYQRRSNLNRNIRIAGSDIDAYKKSQEKIGKEIGERLIDLIKEEIKKLPDNPSEDELKEFKKQFHDLLAKELDNIDKDIKSRIANRKEIENVEEIGTLVRDWELEIKREEAMNVQRDAVKKLVDDYQVEINRIELLMEKLQTQIAAYVAAITNAQLKVVEKIEERTKNVE